MAAPARPIVSRIWTYHQFYDDMVLMIALVAVVRVVREGTPGGERALAAGLGALLWLGLLAPMGLVVRLPGALRVTAELGQAGVWFAALGFLVWRAECSLTKALPAPRVATERESSARAAS